ncbi:MAG: nucleotidyltransferase domain-containing protein [Anaerolineae bacterium]
MSANIRFEDWEAEQMKDPEFRAAVEELEPAYQVTRLRLLRGLSQRQLAELVGTRQPSIARLESGSTEPKIAFLRRIAKALNARLVIRLVPEEEVAQGEQAAGTPVRYAEMAEPHLVRDADAPPAVSPSKVSIRRAKMPEEEIADFCRRWRVTELALFGSVLREDFASESDVDVLVTFAEDASWGLLDLVTMQEELEVLLGRPVDLLERRAVEEAENYIRRSHILSALEPVYVAR